MHVTNYGKNAKINFIFCVFRPLKYNKNNINRVLIKWHISIKE